MESRPRLAIGDVVRLRPPPVVRDRTKLVGGGRTPSGSVGCGLGSVGGGGTEGGVGGVDGTQPEEGSGPAFEVQVI